MSLHLMRRLRGLTRMVLLLSVLSFSGVTAQTVVNTMPEPAEGITTVQHGATLFTQYCLGCHAVKSVSVTRLEALGLSAAMLASYGVDISQGNEYLQAGMPAEIAQQVFGRVPPDLSAIVTQKTTSTVSGRDWIYTYLRSYYQDTESDTGWNNALYPGTKMPHILASLQGVYAAQWAENNNESDSHTSHTDIVGYTQVESGSLSTVEYDQTVADIVHFLEWTTEPIQYERRRLGVWVLLFLGVFAILMWRLHAWYWKDIR